MATLLLAILLAASPAPPAGDCDDPLPIDPAVVTTEMSLKAFGGADQLGPACHLRLGRKFTSAKQAADQYGGESPKGVEPVPGVPNGYMVFDPKTPNRRLFVEYKKKVYMIVSQDQVPLAILAKAVIQQ